jgi:putative ABC transport system ATP-binding protein
MGNIIELKDISKTYRAGEVDVSALKDVTVDIQRGTLVSFVGPSGSGKTTLLNLIGALDTPTTGIITIQGTNTGRLRSVDRARFRGRNIGFIFQDFNLIPVFTVFENIEYPLILVKKTPKGERGQIVSSLLEKVGMLDHGDKFPNQLSGGQKQRVAVARALTTSPGIVLADEPTANLDSDSAYMVINLMKKLRDESGVTFIFSTHDTKIVGEVDIVHTLEDGVIKESRDVKHG